MNKWLPLILLSAACATAPPPAAVPPAPAPPPPAATHLDAAAFQKELQTAYDDIVAREHLPVNPPAVDVEAAASMPIPDQKSVRGAISLFSNEMKGDIQAYLSRSARYKKLIDKSLAEAGLPKGLAYLPVIESGYAPTLTSSAGAHGIWQFMSETAREYGLRVDWWVDERADPERSTRAAAKYLKDLYRQFDDWPLTLAAYNAGPGRIHRALSTSGATTFWELSDQAAIPKETRGYVPTFYAALVIASDPQTYGFRLGDTADDIEAKRVEIEGPVSLRYVAEVADVDESLLRELNPALRRGVVPPGRAQIRVPVKAADTVAARATTLRREDADIKLCAFTLREGDSLQRLAQSLGTSVETLLAMNSLDSPRAVGEGDSIYLPVRARELGPLLSRDSGIYYAVRKGDTLYSIAKRHSLTVEELRDLNDFSSAHKLRVGERVRVNAPRTLSAGGM
ncbi:MAG TPA: transglycosylase SLT domain-containing protein [Thermoanaerobaculia bacterium]|jgi:membrane-bound lytic murein transglycosylase D|nr:transglycosylase SLT domain-containing protein [Thermoanaerobaculia bacterium]